jgi:putative ATPase
MFETNIPLAERIRPSSLDTFIGQKHLVGPGAVIRKAIEIGNIPSMILWGPPGVGKTTLANIIANQLKRPFYMLSAVSAGVKDVREVIERAKGSSKTILFIDEIHRFSKSQQDALLGAVEKGTITLIGATTENPSFEVISALLSRCQVYILKALEKQDLIQLVDFAIKNDVELKEKNIQVKEHEALLNISGGDARRLLNLVELVVTSTNKKDIVITDEAVMEVAQRRVAMYDKKGEMHYDVISAFIKSVRGSDPNGAIYWLARMIEGGEDVAFIARRLVILASEDIGNANPTALVMATNCFQAVKMIGYPESDIILSQCTAYLATSPKSNASYMAIRSAQDLVRKYGDLQVPIHIRNAPTKLMKDIGYGKEYKYSHDYENNFEKQEYLPSEISGTILYDPGNNARENEMRLRLKKLWEEKYGY